MRKAFRSGGMVGTASRAPRPALAAMGTMGLLLIAAGIWAPAQAGATFTGSANGNIAFAAVCNGPQGQPTWTLNPNGSPPPTSTCPGGTAPNYTQETAGSTDSMPFFDATGTEIYFSSDRGDPATNPPYRIYEVAYPATGLSGTSPNQTDAATPLTTPPTGANDYAPTVNSAETEMTFIRCVTTCNLYLQSPISGGTPTQISTSVALAQPNATDGEASRAEINPQNPHEAFYVGTDGHIHLVSLTSPASFPERDLSAETNYTGSLDEYPDWSPDGNRIIFDRNKFVWVLDPTTATATTCELWGSSDPGHEIEPLFAPADTSDSSSATCNPAGNTYVWTKLGSGSNIQLDEGHGVGSPMSLDNLTQNRTNNSQTTWQPAGPGVGTPEVPMALVLPLAGGALIGGALLLEANRRRKGVTVGIG